VCCSIDRVKSRGSGENDWLVLVESIKEVDRRRSLRHPTTQPNNVSRHRLRHSRDIPTTRVGRLDEDMMLFVPFSGGT
jgi:hypothetical protein